MTDFRTRGKAEEAMYGKKQSQNFATRALRNRKVARWLASEFELDPDTAAAYVEEIVLAHLENMDDLAALERFSVDVKRHQVEISDYMIKRQMEIFLEEARSEILVRTVPLSR